MSQANLSETLFKPRFKHPETSTLVRRFTGDGLAAKGRSGRESSG